MPLRFRLALAVGSALSWVSQATGRGGGSVIGGRATLAIDRSALKRLSAGRDVVLVSGTNGKTTTTKLISTAIALSAADPLVGLTEGSRSFEPPAVVTNHQGANLPAGLVTALARGPQSPSAVLEVDEAWLAEAAAEAGPRALVLLNLSRDQLDRYYEVGRLARAWARLCQNTTPQTTVIANADDPLVAWAASHALRVTWVAAGARWRSDAHGCPRCSESLTFSMEGWHCRGCGLERPVVEVWFEEKGAITVARWRSGQSVAFQLGLPGSCNRSNAVMALAAVRELGAPLAEASRAMAAISEVDGRYSLVSCGPKSGRLLLAKNPAGWLDALEMLKPAPSAVVVAINARSADGKDPSWLWDVPFEHLRGRPVTVTGERASDVSVRLHYAGVSHRVEPDMLEALSGTALSDFDVIANYTAFVQLRAAATEAGPTSWQRVRRDRLRVRGGSAGGLPVEQGI